MTEGLTFHDIGVCIWEKVRSHDRIAYDVLNYFATKGKDRAVCVMELELDHHDDELEGAYHCLCGLDLLEPYIDNEGCECARLTELGREALKRIRGDFQ